MAITSNPLANKSLADFAQDLRTGKITCQSTVAIFIERIKKLNPKLDAVTELCEEDAILIAKSIDSSLKAGKNLGPLAGLPVLVKDLYQVDHLPMTAGSRMDILDLVPKQEGPFIKELRKAGCIILGKTRTTEFAMGGFNLTRPAPWNPCDLNVKRMTGGSSHGSAVAMAAGLCSFALGTDTGGSVRQPAAFIGNVGYKASRDYWPTEGVFPMSPGLDSLGIFTKSAMDAAWITSHLPFSKKFNSDFDELTLQKLSLGIPTHHIYDYCDNETKKAFNLAIARLKKAGVTLVSIEIPEVSEIDAVFGKVVPSDVLNFIGKERFISSKALLDPVVWARTSSAFDMKIKDYLETKKRITEISYVINDRLKNLDGWVCPTIPSSAGPVSSFNSVSKIAEWNRINTSNTRPGNLFNQCGISLPIIGQETGLPLGFQIMCKSLDDEKMLKIACLIEKIICNQPSLELE